MSKCAKLLKLPEELLLSEVKKTSFIIVLSILLLAFYLNFLPQALSYTQEEAYQALTTVHQTIVNCYGATVAAEKAGANITGLTTTLNEAGKLYSKALLARKNEDYNLTVQLVNECLGKLDGFIEKANTLRINALEKGYWDSIYNIVCSSVGAVVIICIAFIIWSLLKKRHLSGRLKVNPENYKAIFITVTFVSALLVASPALSRVLVYPRTEFFTELWILDSNHKAENYPFNISSNQDYSIYLGVGNHLGYCAYYMVQVKFRNESQPAPTSLGPIEKRSPSSLQPLYNFTLFVADEDVWETPLTFSFHYYENASRVKVNKIVLNGLSLSLNNQLVAWNSSRNGYYGFLFFELWLYNSTVDSFDYHGRYVGLWLNMTVSS